MYHQLILLLINQDHIFPWIFCQQQSGFNVSNYCECTCWRELYMTAFITQYFKEVCYAKYEIVLAR